MGERIATKQVIVRRYGLRAPLDWDQDAHEQLFLQNRLWNRLVEIDQAHNAKLRETTDNDAAIAVAVAEFDALRGAKEQTYAERKALRKKARAKVATPMLDKQLKEQAAQIKALRPALKVLRKQWRDANADTLKHLEQQRYAAVTQARQESQLYWGNYNAVCESYRIARSRALKTGASLRFHGFTGEGRFTNQIQGGMTAETLFASKHSQVQVDPLPTYAAHVVPGKRKPRRTTLRFCIYRSGEKVRYLTLPLIMHRPLPDDARIKSVTLHREKISTHWKWSVVFTCVRAAASDTERVHAGQHACGIDLGWRKVKTGLRVATISGTDIEPPWHVILPADIVATLDRYDEVQSVLKQRLNEVHAYLKAQSLANPPEVIAERLKRARQAPVIGAGKLALLALVWRECADYAPAVLARLETWRAADRKQRDAAAFLRRNALKRRRYLYELATREIAERYALIGIEKFDLAQAKRREQPDSTENALPPPARLQRDRASVALLRLWLRNQAVKTGAVIIEVLGKTTLACRHCGTINRPHDRSRLIWQCEGCGAVWDQDTNASKNILSAVAGEPASADVMRVEPVSARSGKSAG